MSEEASLDEAGPSPSGRVNPPITCLAPVWPKGSTRAEQAAATIPESEQLVVAPIGFVLCARDPAF